MSDDSSRLARAKAQADIIRQLLPYLPIPHEEPMSELHRRVAALPSGLWSTAAELGQSFAAALRSTILSSRAFETAPASTASSATPTHLVCDFDLASTQPVHAVVSWTKTTLKVAITANYGADAPFAIMLSDKATGSLLAIARFDASGPGSSSFELDISSLSVWPADGIVCAHVVDVIDG